MAFDNKKEYGKFFLAKQVPNIISASRGVATIVILFCWCGFSDMIDGALARKLGVASGTGAKIDSLADLTFVICSAISILPSVDLPVWIWLWIAAIGIVKLVGIIIGSCRQRMLSIPHSISNRLTGILLFFLPFAIVQFDILIPVVFVCVMATFSLLEDFQIPKQPHIK